MVAAKYPAALLTQADMGGPMSGIPFNEWTANGATLAGAATPFSLVVNEAIDASVPAAGKLTTANGEVLHYSAYVAGTKTFTIDARAQDGTTAAAIDNGSAVGQWLTRDQWNQLVADLIAIETQLGVNFAGGAKYNYLTNPGFEIDQRGGSVTASAAYAHDRWQLTLAGTDTATITDETSIVDTTSLHALKAVVVVGTGAGASNVGQVLKNADLGASSLRGQTVCFAIRVRTATAAACKAAITTDGTGGTTTLSSFHTGGGAYETLSVSVAVPADATTLTVKVTFAVSCTAYLDNATLVIGSSAQTYQPLHPAEEWERCQRYYEIKGGQAARGVGLVGYGTNAASYGSAVMYATKKAVIAPTQTKNGTWGVGNVNQPSVATEGDDHAFWIEAAGNNAAAAQVYFFPDSADDNVTAEANP